jgi:UDPglucose 6-dehydrogenase
MINNQQSFIQNTKIEHFFNNRNLNSKATLNKEEAYLNADFVIIATPTNYVSEKKFL